jgi:hypothetical protein
MENKQDIVESDTPHQRIGTSAWVVVQVFELVGGWLYLHDHITLFESNRDLWCESQSYFLLLKCYEYTVRDEEIEQVRYQCETEGIFDDAGDTWSFYDSD